MEGGSAVNPIEIPSQNDLHLPSHHFNMFQPCPKGMPKYLCGFTSALPKSSNENILVAKTGVSNSRKALLSHGIGRAKDAQINVHNIPFVLNEPKLKNYFQLLNWNMQSLLAPANPKEMENKLAAQTTIKKSFMTPAIQKQMKVNDMVPPKGVIHHGDALHRLSNLYNFTSIPRGNYLPISYNTDRLIHNANNIVHANGQTNYLMPKEEKNILWQIWKNPQIM